MWKQSLPSRGPATPSFNPYLGPTGQACFLSQPSAHEAVPTVFPSSLSAFPCVSPGRDLSSLHPIFFCALPSVLLLAHLAGLWPLLSAWFQVHKQRCPWCEHRVNALLLPPVLLPPEMCSSASRISSWLECYSSETPQSISCPHLSMRSSWPHMEVS